MEAFGNTKAEYKSIMKNYIKPEIKEMVEIKVVTPPKTEQGCNCLICPKCGAHEIDHDWKPTTEKEKKEYIFGKRFNIRAFKVDDSSHCLKCDCWFDLDGTYT